MNRRVFGPQDRDLALGLRRRQRRTAWRFISRKVTVIGNAACLSVCAIMQPVSTGASGARPIPPRSRHRAHIVARPQSSSASIAMAAVMPEPQVVTIGRGRSIARLEQDIASRRRRDFSVPSSVSQLPYTEY